MRYRDRHMLLSSDRTGPEAEIVVKGLALCGFREHFEAIALHVKVNAVVIRFAILFWSARAENHGPHRTRGALLRNLKILASCRYAFFNAKLCLGGQADASGMLG
jgi:hypothetical protein